MKRVSVIVPVYNTAPYVERCINSLLGQTYRDLDIWAVDDGSTDGSWAVLERLEKQDARLHCLQVAHGGVSAARNAALAKATGDCLAFLDSDDWLESDALECLVRDLETHNADVVFFNSTCEWPSGAKLRVEHPLVGEANRDELLRQALRSADENGAHCGYFLSVTNKLFRVSSLKAQSGAFPLFDPTVSMLEDGLWLMESLPSFSKGFLNGRGFYHRTYRTDSATGDDSHWFRDVERYTRSYLRLWDAVRERAGEKAALLAQDSLFGTLENAMHRDAIETGGERIDHLLRLLPAKDREVFAIKLLRTGIVRLESEPYHLGQKLYGCAPVRGLYRLLKALKHFLKHH